MSISSDKSLHLSSSLGLLAATIVVCLGSLLPVAAQQEPAVPDSQPAVDKTAEESRSEAIILPAGTQIPLVLQNTINTRNSRTGDNLYFETLYPIVHEGRIVIPVGSYVRGTLTLVKRPGRLKGRAELHVRIEEMTLPNGYTVKLPASLSNTGTQGGEEVDRTEGGVKGEGSKGKDAGTIVSSTTSGAIIGAGTTGTRAGMRTGTIAGAAAGLATVLLTRGKELILPRGTTVDISLDRPLSLDPALAKFDWTDYSAGRRRP